MSAVLMGAVIEVSERQVGSPLAAAVSIGATSLTLDSSEEFEGATAVLIDDEVIAVTGSDPTARTVALGAAAVAAHDAGTFAAVYPTRTVRWAFIQLTGDTGDALVARVPQALYAQIPAGDRSAVSDQETVLVEREGPTTWVVKDLVGVGSKITAVVEIIEPGLLRVSLVSGWKVEIGDPDHPLRYWDGADTRLDLDDDGNVTIVGTFANGDTPPYIELTAVGDVNEIGFIRPAGITKGKILAADDNLSISPPADSAHYVSGSGIPVIQLGTDNPSTKKNVLFLLIGGLDDSANAALIDYGVTDFKLLTGYPNSGYVSVRARNDDAGSARTFGHGTTYGGVNLLANDPTSITFSSTGEADVGGPTVSAGGITNRGFRFQAAIPASTSVTASRFFTTVGN